MSYTRLLRDDAVEECLALVAREDGTGGGLPNTASALRGHVAALKSERDEWQRRAESLLKQAEGLEAEAAYQKGRDDERAFSAPSGQVADDAAKALAGLDWGRIAEGQYVTADESRGAIHRLATKAQGYEAAVADNEALLSAARNYDAFMDLSEPWSDGDLGIEDASALNAASRVLHAVIHRPHPGAALLEQHRKALVRARNEGLEKAAERMLFQRDALRARTDKNAAGRRFGLEEAAAIARHLREPEQ
jgi:hypothetical protein